MKLANPCLAAVAALLLAGQPARAQLSGAVASAADERAERSADEASSEVASAWFELLYDVVKLERTGPPQASRIFGITAVALYEAVAPGSRELRALDGQLNELTAAPRPNRDLRYDWPTVASSAIAGSVRGLYPKLYPASASLLDIRQRSIDSSVRRAVPEDVYTRSVTYGNEVAAHILAWAATDGLARYTNCPNIPKRVAGAWKPTAPLYLENPTKPCWGLLRPMVLKSGNECAPGGHPGFSTDERSDFYAAALEVYDVARTLTEEQRTIADYWADEAGATGTPPGHWIAIVSQIARKDQLSLARAAEAYARAGIALHDGFIGCWKVKYDYNLLRPVTYINEVIDASWRPLRMTPSFPAYASGHSTQSGAAAWVLTDMFGDYAFTDTTHTDHGLRPPEMPRTFSSFNDAAAEAAVSRLYGGIHYKFDNDDGLASGECIGQKITQRVRFGN